ncbi:hypothetical protein UFOVP645_3 [uncultured Caudovirales phage]|uniref:Uncharacterized protein n=1 Tax=uncultured Caudovirales phage TaxID=2100421 RepID=A0A6J5NAI3_9CAUD|nr:hypothetical protein UFOVP645_3 [uncultured Caudovirales phage]
MTTGFEKINQSLYIDKDPEAVLNYSFDWTDWLAGDTLSTQTYSIQTRTNDPAPLARVTSGIVGNKTYIRLSGGQNDKTYLVTVKITTTGGFTDRRNFRVRVINRSA